MADDLKKSGVSQPYPEDFIPTPADYRTAMWREDPLLTQKLLAAQGIGLKKILNNPEDAMMAVDNQAKALRYMSEMLNSPETLAKMKKQSPEQLAKTLSYVAKTMDETARLLEYAAGRADSRTEVVGLSDLLKYLSNEQFEQVQGWIAIKMRDSVEPSA